MSNLKLSDDRISDALQSVQGGRSAFEVIYRTHEHWPLPSVGDVAGGALVPYIIVSML